jgi:hypothetical protein
VSEVGLTVVGPAMTGGLLCSVADVELFVHPANNAMTIKVNLARTIDTPLKQQ